MGGHHDAVLRRAARLADGWMSNYRTPEAARPALDALDRYLSEAGRLRDDFGVEARIPYDPERWEALLRDWEALGATHISMNTMGRGFTTPDDHLKAIRTFAKMVTGDQ
jgi:alkanesulfonate monooxygenase SsuD/methylene tetrahydromethanopterin reductase-like flavin-dependent oxidoreductase (luciferase family)